MKTKFITFLLILISLLGFSQEKEETTNFLPVQFIKVSNTVKLDNHLFEQLKGVGLRVVKNQEVKPNGWGYFMQYGTNKKTYLVNISGKVRLIPDEWDLVAPLENGNLIITDKGIEKTGVFHYKNIRIVDSEGKEIPSKSELTNYVVILNSSGKQYINHKKNTYVMIFNPSTSLYNIIDKEGNILFKNDVYSISFLFGDFILIRETYSSKDRVFQIEANKYFDLAEYTFINALPAHNILMYKSSLEDKYCFYDPIENKVLFENKNQAYSIIQNNEIVKDFFRLAVSSQRSGFYYQVIDRNGKPVLPGNYKKIIFYNDSSNTVEVYNDAEQYQIYDLKKQQFLLPYFVKKIIEMGGLVFTLKDKFYIVTNKETGEQIYDESDMVRAFYERGNMCAIERLKFPDRTISSTDVYSKTKSEFVFKDIRNLNAIGYSTNGASSGYYTISSNSSSYTITDKDGNIILPNIYINWKIQFNPSKQTFEIINKKGKVLESYDREGNKLKNK